MFLQSDLHGSQPSEATMRKLINAWLFMNPVYRIFAYMIIGISVGVAVRVWW